MTNESRNKMTSVWKNQPTATMDIPLEQLRRKAQKLQSRVRWRNLREYCAGAIVVGTFGYCAWIFPTSLARLGSALLILGTLFVLVTLHKRGASFPVSAEAAFKTCIDFHRNELMRQRDLLRSVWSWYLLPLVPGMAVFLTGLFRQTMRQPNAPAHMLVIIAGFAFTAVLCAVVFFTVAKLNYWAAGKLQQEIESLDVLARES